jgi:hypothetical protein
VFNFSSENVDDNKNIMDDIWPNRKAFFSDVR